MDEEQEKRVREIIKEEMEGTFAYVFSKHIQVLDGRNIQVGKTTGTKIGTETTQKIGFFGSTPIIKQTTISQSPADFSAGTSEIVNDSATWGGYTVGDLVNIFKAFGLIT